MTFHQVCMSTERVLVHKSIYAEFEKLVTERVSKLRSGDPAEGLLVGAINRITYWECPAITESI